MMKTIKNYWKNFSFGGKTIMTITLPIFIFVAKTELILAKLTGTTYNVINIVLYYLLIPLSWTIMFDYWLGTPITTYGLIFFWFGIKIGTWGRFRIWSNWAFMRSVDFLNYFNRWGGNYILNSVIICVLIPLLIYAGLIYLLIM